MTMTSMFINYYPITIRCITDDKIGYDDDDDDDDDDDSGGDNDDEEKARRLYDYATGYFGFLIWEQTLHFCDNTATVDLRNVGRRITNGKDINNHPMSFDINFSRGVTMRRALAFMSSGERRKSTRITALEESKKEGKRKALNTSVDSRRRRKKRNYQRHKASSSNNSENRIHTDSDDLALAVMSEKDKRKLGLLLGTLQRRDYRNFFAEPVDEEEVEDYYDVITHPMDFGTISNKLNEGSYSTLEEFKRYGYWIIGFKVYFGLGTSDDIFLVFNNCFRFNDSNTVYYRKARGLERDAHQLFDTLENDPSNFEAECFKMGEDPTGKGKGVARTSNSDACKIGERQSESFEADRRDSYMPVNSQNENDLLISMVLESQQQLMRMNGGKFDYAKRITLFTKDLGPTAQAVACQKIAQLTEASRISSITGSQSLPCNESPFKNSFLRREKEGGSSVGPALARGGYKGKQIQVAMPNPKSVDAYYQRHNKSFAIPGNLEKEEIGHGILDGARAYPSPSPIDLGASSGGSAIGSGIQMADTSVHMKGWGVSSVGPTVGGERSGNRFSLVGGGMGSYTMSNQNDRGLTSGGSAMSDFSTESVVGWKGKADQQHSDPTFGTGIAFNNPINQVSAQQALPLDADASFRAGFHFKSNMVDLNSTDKTYDFLGAWNSSSINYRFPNELQQIVEPFQKAPSPAVGSFYQNQTQGKIAGVGNHYLGNFGDVEDGGQVLSLLKPVELDPPQVVAGMQHGLTAAEAETWRQLRTFEDPSWVKDLNNP
ncbi:hypothetical protein ACFE04_030366 [Oxalis oulophora]